MKPQIMMPTLFSLLTIIALGTILYVYLRQEQNKVIPPKDKYDEAWNDFYNNTQPTHPTLKSWIHRNLFFIFLFTFVFFPIFTILSIGIINGASIIDNIGLSSGLLTSILISLPLFLIVIFLLSTTGINRQTSPLIYLAAIMFLIISIIVCGATILPRLDFSGLN